MGSGSDDDNDVLSREELNLGGAAGLISSYFVLSGTVVLFLVLRPLKLYQPILNALGEFRVVGMVLLAIVALFINTVVFGFLILNADKVKHIFR